ncbi:hypothetical protein BAE44_0011102 [Dichanthelium oligosanthes]|uniref:SANT domain-containing protein n=1 Tax=Dichanthelium oligosanthes TaxID=888268 RepID=A0A1E5VRY4_9POAL|nr:hypothetical protein BAE44_0011102 [Dichanthelium oligosanthes]
MDSESFNLEDNGDHQPSSEASLASDVIYDDSPVPPCIGSEHQAEIPNLATEDERRELMAGSLNGSTSHGYGYPIVVGLALPIMWASPSEVNKKEDELHMQIFSESETRGSSGDVLSQVTSTCPINNNTSKCDPTFQDQHTVVPAVQTERDSNQAHDDKMAPFPTQKGLNVTNYQIGAEQLNPLPYSPIALWTDLEAELFLLGLYIFGKNLNLLSRFLGTKTVGDVLSYYYGKFYKRDAYRRWSDCRKAKTRKCILGERIFQGWRQQELISRLKSKIPKEDHDSLIEVFKSFSDSQTSLKEFVFALKSIVGTEVFVEAVGVGKGKHDLTGFIMDQSKPNHAAVHSDLPTGKDCSSLASEDIIKFLTGDFRRSKTRSNDIFWEAVWPRLLAKGWHSEQPKDVSTTKNCLVFLMPGIKKFSRSKLTKGTHYFDSVSDVLKRVAVDPVLLELEVDGVDHGLTAEKNCSITDMKLNQDSPLDGYPELPKFTIIDTSLVEGEEPFNVRELRNLPADANISFVLSHHASNMVSYSSSEEEDVNDRVSDDKEDCGRVTAEVKEIEMVSVGSLRNMVTANGHSSNGNDDKIDLTGIYGIKTKPERRKYLSPVSKRRRLTSCSEQSSRRSFSFSKGGVLEKEKSKPLSTSKSAAVDVGDTFQTKTIASCSTKEKPSEQKMDASNSVTNDGQNERMIMENLIEDKSFEHKADAVAETHSKITADETKYAKERAHVSGPIKSNKLKTPHDGRASGSICARSSENHSGVKADEAPTISNSNMARDPSEATGRPAGQQPEPAVEANPRRHGTRNRPPTARALEAVAFGLLGSGKRKGDPKNMATNRPSRRARKATKVLAPTASSGDTESSVDAEVHP